VPKLVDHDARRTELAQALWRLVRRDGVAAASVRSVAAEAGWSPSALRYYFSTQSELLAFAMQHVVGQARERAMSADLAGPVRVVAQHLLEQILPLDDDRKLEAQVWLALAGHRSLDSAAQQSLEEADDAVEQVTALVLTAAARQGRLPADRDAGVEAAKLHALVDGLTLHALTRPRTATPARIRAILADHLDQLLGPEPVTS
jgi:AcrR family transcriptional regulator